MEELIALLIGIGLSATCGFRVFVPLLGMSIACQAGQIELSAGFAWIGSWPALITFAVATVVEVGAYYVPWVDNLLDSIATPAAVVAGTIVTASMTGDLSPLLRWSLAVIAGGGTAGVFQGGSALLRGVSTATTGGVANPAVSTGELVVSVMGTVLSILVPLVAVVLFGALLLLGTWLLLRRRKAPAA